MNTTQPIAALPLCLASLDSQIRAQGGSGFNTKVTKQHVPNSFSLLFTFDTPDGPKTLLTHNEVKLGRVDDFDIMFNGDTGEYFLSRLIFITNTLRPLRRISVFALSYPSAMEALQQGWPNRINWDVKTPESLLPN